MILDCCGNKKYHCYASGHYFIMTYSTVSIIVKDMHRSNVFSPLAKSDTSAQGICSVLIQY